jgi:hypothetical protein
MPAGGEGELTLSVKMRVSPEPEQQQALLDLMRKYRDALNYSVRAIIANKALSLSRAHRLLYNDLRERYGLPSRVAQDCYREAIAIAKSWLRNQKRGEVPTAKRLSVWLTHELSYRVKGDHVELAGGYRLRVTGWDRRYDDFPNREARLVFRDGRFDLYVAKRVPRPAKYAPKGVLAVDVNERQIVVGNTSVEQRMETPVERALHYMRLAEGASSEVLLLKVQGLAQEERRKEEGKALPQEGKEHHRGLGQEDGSYNRVASEAGPAGCRQRGPHGAGGEP